MVDYKIKNILYSLKEKSIEIPTDLQENIDIIIGLSDNFTVEDDTAFELDQLMKIELDDLYNSKVKEDSDVDLQEDEVEDLEINLPSRKTETTDSPQVIQTVFNGVDYKYKNRYELNKGIESLLDSKETFTADEKIFMSKYSGYGGLEKYGAKGEGLFHEFYTPDEIVKKMWALAYKHGYSGGNWVESSCGTGRFIKHSPTPEYCTAYEINPYSAKISRILYPEATVYIERFEKLFIKNNSSVKGKTQGMQKFELNIGNPPYKELKGEYFGMGERDYSKASNMVEYFIFRGLDLLEKNGLLIMVVGAEQKNGGVMFLDSKNNKCKEMIAEKGELVEAYKLPSGIFLDTGVSTEILVIRKK